MYCNVRLEIGVMRVATQHGERPGSSVLSSLGARYRHANVQAEKETAERRLDNGDSADMVAGEGEMCRSLHACTISQESQKTVVNIKLSKD